MHVYICRCMHVFTYYIYLYTYINQYINWRAMLSSDLQCSTLRTLQRTSMAVSLEVLKSEDGATRRAYKRHFFSSFFIESNHHVLFLWESRPCNPAVAALLQLCCSCWVGGRGQMVRSSPPLTGT